MISCRVIPKVSIWYLPTLYRNSPTFSHELWHFTPQVQKRHDYAIKRKTIKNQHHCTAFGFASGYTEVLQGGTISMPTDRHVDNLYCLLF